MIANSEVRRLETKAQLIRSRAHIMSHVILSSKLRIISLKLVKSTQYLKILVKIPNKGNALPQSTVYNSKQKS